MQGLKSADQRLPSFARDCLRYERETGFLYWKRHPWTKTKNGKRTDIQASLGYRTVCCKGRQYAAHRVAWLLETGTMPQAVDHINGIRSDNRWTNLREADYALNAQNLRSAKKGNIAGLLGVRQRGNKFSAEIYAGSFRLNLGSHATAQEAHKAYVQAKRVLHPGCTI